MTRTGRSPPSSIRANATRKAGCGPISAYSPMSVCLRSGVIDIVTFPSTVYDPHGPQPAFLDPGQRDEEGGLRPDLGIFADERLLALGSNRHRDLSFNGL